MTTRHAGYVVTLEQDIREDEDDHIVPALRMVKGVVSVEPIVGDYDLHVAEERARSRYADVLWEMRQKMLEVKKP